MNKTLSLQGGGTLYIKDQGSYFFVEAIRPNDQKGLYRVHLKGLMGTQQLGTLTPEGDYLRLARMVPRNTLERWGCYPITGGECICFFPFEEKSEQSNTPTEPEQEEQAPICPSPKSLPELDVFPPKPSEQMLAQNPQPEGWEPCSNPSERVVGRTLGEGFAALTPVYYRKRNHGFSLAVPIRCEEEFTLTPLLCIGKPIEIGGEQFVAFGFDPTGKPCREHEQ